MKKVSFWMTAAILCTLCFAAQLNAQTSRKSVSAKEATGTFRMEFTGKFEDIGSEINLLPIGKGKIRVTFELVYPYITGDGEMSANLGTAEGIAEITGDTAIFASDEFGECRITIKFVKRGMIDVRQEGTPPDCGFGHNVTASGVYKRTSKAKPKFDDAETN